MFENSYPFTFLQKRKPVQGEFFLVEYKYTFKARDKGRYIVNIEEYPFHVFIVKFHLKAHTDSERKYQFQTNSFDATIKIATCVEIMLQFYKKNNKSSFGFIGAHSEGEDKENSKRFRIYRMVMENFFAPIKFHHQVYEKESAYILLNKSNETDNLLSKIEEMFKKYYLFL